MECRDQTTGVEHRYGCRQQVAWWLEPWSATIAGINFAIVVLDFVTIVVMSKMRRALNAYEAYYGGQEQY